MKAKAILTTLLLIIVVASVVMIFLNNNDAVADNNDAPTEAVAQDEQVADLPEKTTVYYFHGNTRCVTCKTIEKFTKEAVDQGFSEQVKKRTYQSRLHQS